MRTDLEKKTRPVITMIDLDASANFGDIVGLKWSSAFAPPELAALIYEYAQLPAEGRVAWEEYVTSHPNKVLASTAFDVWAFGMILYILCAHEGASVFLTSATDNIVRPEELRRLAYEWEEHKLEEVSQLVWAHAQDLALWCLQTDPSRRPSSFKDILDHPFLGGKGKLRFLGDVRAEALAAFEDADADDNGTLDKAEAAALTRTIAESGTVDLETAERLMEQAMNPGGKAGMEQSAMDFDAFFEGYVRVSGKTLMHITANKSIELHTAIRDGSLDAVEELFASGAVHCSLPLFADGVPNAQGVLPLHRAARHGRLDICLLYTSDAADE